MNIIVVGNKCWVELKAKAWFGIQGLGTSDQSPVVMTHECGTGGVNEEAAYAGVSTSRYSQRSLLICSVTNSKENS
ncbi:hypothetical protein MHYP_G00313740 [Metynnis hypsauchen]